eukprot:XP_013987901.1 PREDICTED: uncharacterized protein LOC106565380 isoform X1 [Salmo salar]
MCSSKDAKARCRIWIFYLNVFSLVFVEPPATGHVHFIRTVFQNRERREYRQYQLIRGGSQRGMVMQSSKMPPPPAQTQPLAQKSAGNTKRPDKAIYIPKAARDRQRDSGGSLHTPPAGVDLDLPLLTLSWTSSGSTSSGCTSSGCTSSGCTSSGCTSHPESCCSCPCSSHTTEGTPSETPSTTNQDSVPSITSSAGQEDDFIRFSAEEPCPWPPAWDQTLSYFMAVTLEDQTEKEEEEEVAEEVLTEEESVCSSNMAPHQHHVSHTTPAKDAAGDAADFSQEITAHLTDVAIEHAHNDYSCFGNVWINQDEYDHVIEIYDFPAMFKTDDLLDAFADYRVYPASKGEAMDRLCGGPENGDHSPGAAARWSALTTFLTRYSRNAGLQLDDTRPDVLANK